jgi:hypothetical protein
MRSEMIKLYHEPPNAGHRGVNQTSARIKNDLVWSSIDNDVKQYIKYCDDCQKAKKYGPQAMPFRSAPVPRRCFDEISLDVVGPIPMSQSGMKYVLVTQDRLSRWVQFAPMTNTSANTTTRTFLRDWVCTYGPPSKLLTDRGTNFMSAWFQGLARFLGTEPTKCVAYRAQANGQNERSHRELSNFLKLYLDENHRDNWDTMLAMAAWVHNTTTHRALKMSPYEVVTGMKPKQARMWLPGEAEHLDEDDLHAYFGIRKERLAEIRGAAIAAIQKGQDDFLELQGKKRIPHNFKVGQQVLIRDQQAKRWTPSYYGPFEVIKVMDSTLQLRDPGSGKLDTVHADHCKPYFDKEGLNRAIQPLDFPGVTEDSEHEIVLDPEYYPPEDPETDITLEFSREGSPDPPTREPPPTPKDPLLITPKPDESLLNRARNLASSSGKAIRRLFRTPEEPSEEVEEAVVSTPASRPPRIPTAPSKQATQRSVHDTEVQPVGVQPTPQTIRRRRRRVEELTLEAAQDFLEKARETSSKTAEKSRLAQEKPPSTKKKGTAKKSVKFKLFKSSNLPRPASKSSATERTTQVLPADTSDETATKRTKKVPPKGTKLPPKRKLRSTAGNWEIDETL